MNFSEPQSIINSQREIEEIIGYSFGTNRRLLVQAFTRKSFAEENEGIEDNEVLEFYGDQLVNTIMTKWMFDSFSQYSGGFQNDYYYSKKNEAELSEIRASYINKSALAHCIRILQLDCFLLLGKGDIKKEIWNNDKVLCDLFEAIIGAIAVHSATRTSNGYKWNYDIIEKSCKKMWDMLDIKEDYVEELECLCEEMDIDYPKYIPQPVYLTPSGQEYRCKIELYNDDGNCFKSLEASGNTKVVAQLNVAQAAINYLVGSQIKTELQNATPENALELLNVLFLRKQIAKPEFNFPSCKNEDGNQVWTCKCYITTFENLPGYKEHGIDTGYTKQEAKQNAAYDLICWYIDKPNENRIWICPECGAENYYDTIVCTTCNEGVRED